MEKTYRNQWKSKESEKNNRTKDMQETNEKQRTCSEHEGKPMKKGGC